MLVLQNLLLWTVRCPTGRAISSGARPDPQTWPGDPNTWGLLARPSKRTGSRIHVCGTKTTGSYKGKPLHVPSLRFGKLFPESASVLTTFLHRDWFGSMDRASPWGLKGPGFDSSQGHVPWLRAHPQ
uniref:Uncharacterized protein n=1 Tax=Pipistrellus kuhlii TaxID=59472 RepID=A0A7J7YNC0_PIPKU|nr:hypothetical protein mPipKuh1_010163 [Pipistrellus kuhlii]